MRSKRHTVELEKLTSYTVEEHIAISNGKGSDKRLTVYIQIYPLTSPNYDVFSQGSLVYRGESLAEAITAYNNEP